MPTIDQKALLVKASITQWTARKEDKKVSKEVDAAHKATNAGRYHKYLLAKEALEKISKAGNEARTYHYQHTLPWTLDGLAILPSKIFFEYTKEMGKFKAIQQSAVNEFMANYPRFVDEAKTRLNGLFDPKDYPSAEKLEKKFSFTLEYFPIPSAGDFRVELSQGELDRMKSELSASLKAATQAALKELWTRLYSTVKHAAERLSEKDAIFRDSLIENIKELCFILPKLNITDDPNLEAMRREVEASLTRFSPETLREDPEARKRTAEEATRILKSITPHLDTQEEPEPIAAPPQEESAKETHAAQEEEPREETPTAPRSKEDTEARLEAMQSMF